jgi:small neutral amino acid transporter SnatA (MarC family)
MKANEKRQTDFLPRRLWHSIIQISAILSVMLSLLLPGTLPAFAALPTSPDCALPSPVAECHTPLLAQANPVAESPAPDNAQSREQDYLNQLVEFRGTMGAVNIFIIFFVTLGPLKIVPAFIKLTQNADDSLRRNLAIRSAGLAALVILLVTLLGGNILAKWGVSIAALLIASGTLLFLVSLQSVLSQYEPPEGKAAPPEPSMKLLIHPLTLPTILTPYGIAIALILMVFNTRVSDRPGLVPALLLLVMVLNLLAMLAARPILRTLKPETLQVLGLVLGVMQLALGLEFILSGIQLEALSLQELLR